MRKYRDFGKGKAEYIKCNKCGLDTSYTGHGLFHKIDLYFPFGSKLYGKDWTFDLCDDCIVDMVESFMYQPENIAKY